MEILLRLGKLWLMKIGILSRNYYQAYYIIRVSNLKESKIIKGCNQIKKEKERKISC